MFTKSLITAGMLCVLVVGCSNDSTSSDSSGQTLSDPEEWNDLFMLGAISTEQCEADTLANAESRMTVQGPYSLAEYEEADIWRGARGRLPVSGNRVSRFVQNNITDAHSIYSFLFVDRSGPDMRGVSGYFLAQGQCIVHVDVNGTVF